jgi:hypothetical protein
VGGNGSTVAGICSAAPSGQAPNAAWRRAEGAGLDGARRQQVIALVNDGLARTGTNVPQGVDRETLTAWSKSSPSSARCPPQRRRRPLSRRGGAVTGGSKGLVAQLFLEHHEGQRSFGYHALQGVKNSRTAVEKKALSK